MRPTTAPARVLSAVLPAGEGPGQDVILNLPGAVAVIDGASNPDRTTPDGGDYARALADALRRTLPTARTLTDALRDAITEVRDRLGLRPGHSPSAALGIARWNATAVDVLVLGDVTCALIGTDGAARIITDRRLSAVGIEQRETYRSRLATGHGFDDQHAAALSQLVNAQRRARNQPAGYWIAEADSTAANHAVTITTLRDGLSCLALATDGAAASVDRYHLHTDWQSYIQAFTEADPAQLLRRTQDAEDDDLNGKRWPRSKPHDDKAIAVVHL